MSYILDALRKADAQRLRDPARGIHAQPIRPAFAEGRSAASYRAGLWGAGAAAIMALAVIGWYLSGDDSAVMVLAPPPTGGTGATAPMAAPVPVAVPTPAAVVEPMPVPVTALPPIGPAARPAAGLATPGLFGVPAQRVAKEPKSGRALSPPAAPAPGERVPAIAGLPSDAPKLAISGGVYSDNPAQRMLIVNGQVLHEGAEVAPGIVLEQIRPRAAVLNFRGGRYTVAY